LIINPYGSVHKTLHGSKGITMRVKILLVGSVGENIQDLVEKLTKLQKSKAGPFDACFCAGSFSKSIVDHPMPLPLYLQDCSRLIVSENSNDAVNMPKGIIRLNNNLFSLQGTSNKSVANVWTIPVGNSDIVVASVPSHARIDSNETSDLREKISHESYVGCDLLLTSETPQGIDKLLPPSDHRSQQEGSFDIADIALRSRPRYHIAPQNVFSQSHPFKHLPSSTSSFDPKHTGRFISLGPVVSAKVAKEKGKIGKFIHAVGITPLHHMTEVELDEKLENLQQSPYTDDSYGVQNICQKEKLTNAGNNVGISEAQARRLISETSQNDDYRWKGKRKNMGDTQEPNDTTNSTLFLHGLQKDASGQLQNDRSLLLQAFQPYGVIRVRRPPKAHSYAFLDFNSHEEARRCIKETQGRILVVNTNLALSWANSNSSNNNSDMNTSQKVIKKRRLMEADAINSSTLYFRLSNEVSDVSVVSEDLRKLTEQTLELAIGDPSISSENEPALQVRLRKLDDTKHFGFLDFASHAAASMALASLTESTDGGELLNKQDNDKDSKLISDPLQKGTFLHWAAEKKKQERPHNNSMIETVSGVKFERQHFPVDSRTDCWFCLASNSCEKHLVTSVHNKCYVTMTKGPIHKEGHVLVVPVTHSSKGALSDPEVSADVEEMKERLRKHAAEIWSLDLFVFERAIQTKGGYHTHVQCVPVPKGIGAKLQATMVGMGKRCGFTLREINSDLSLGALGGKGYFYSEIPLGGSKFKRFFCNSVESASVPIQFGREVLAAVMDDPKIAHWKACVLSKQEETEMALKFRKSFSKYES